MNKQLKSIKENQFKDFCIIYQKSVNFNSKYPRNKILYGEEKEIAINCLKIIKKYKEKFLSMRNGDIESFMASKSDRESVGSGSYSKHMRANNKIEFSRCYNSLCKYLNVDIFSLEELPVINKDGTIKYKDVQKVEYKDEQKLEYKDEQKVEQKVEKPLLQTKKNNDIWDDYDTIDPPFMTKINIPVVIDGKFVYEKKLI